MPEEADRVILEFCVLRTPRNSESSSFSFSELATVNACCEQRPLGKRRMRNKEWGVWSYRVNWLRADWVSWCERRMDTWWKSKILGELISLTTVGRVIVSHPFSSPPGLWALQSPWLSIDVWSILSPHTCEHTSFPLLYASLKIGCLDNTSQVLLSAVSDCSGVSVTSQNQMKHESSPVLRFLGKIWELACSLHITGEEYWWRQVFWPHPPCRVLSSQLKIWH